ncbi:MAG: hypothetical protein AAF253_00010 [Pseudomonadota bacterium]
MFMSMLIIIGAIAGLALSALSHPMIYRGIFGGPQRSGDHKPSRY